MNRFGNRIAVWGSLFVLGGVGFGALITLSVMLFRLDRAESEARRDAAVEQAARLALWRLDAALAPMIAEETVRPVVAYSEGGSTSEEPSVTAGMRTDERTSALVGTSATTDRTLPLGELPVRNRFDVSSVTGKIESAEGAAGELDLAALRRLPILSATGTWTSAEGVRFVPERVPFDNPELVSNSQRSGIEGSRGWVELQNRGQAVMSNGLVAQRVQSGQRPITNHSGSVVAPMSASWIEGELILARLVRLSDGERIQGAVLDWSTLRDDGLAMIEDLLPEATLEPAPPDRSSIGAPDTLASLPIRLVPGDVVTELPSSKVPVGLTLAVAWSGMLVAGVLGLALVIGMARLSERRAAFVSAVTHELRTPLTTFQLYTDMLASGMVRDEATRQTYLETLRGESLRLNHLIDNVLSYARLERGRRDVACESIALGELIGAVEGRLRDVASRHDMTLEVETGPAMAEVVRANRSVVEQILFNLVDNTCRYAGEAADRRIVLSASGAKGRRVELRVRDYGPGMSGGGWPRPFGKSAAVAAESAPGIGLGLALSRRLARRIGGELRIDRSVHPGACVVLGLRRSESGEGSVPLSDRRGEWSDAS